MSQTAVFPCYRHATLFESNSQPDSQLIQTARQCAECDVISI